MHAKQLSRIAVQALIVLAVAGLLALLVTTTAGHLAQRGIRSGFDFLLEPAGFTLGESAIPLDALEKATHFANACAQSNARTWRPGFLEDSFVRC